MNPAVQYFERGASVFVDGEVTFQKYKWPPPDMQRGCETFVQDSEETILANLLIQGDTPNDVFVKRVCYERTTSCSSSGGVSNVQSLAPTLPRNLRATSSSQHCFLAGVGKL